MTKIFVILFVALLFEGIGVVLLSKGLKQVDEMKTVSFGAVVRVIKQVVTNKNVLLGILFEALFFAGLLVLMSMGDLTFVWPLTSLSFVISTVTARIFLNEHVSGIRWGGVLLIMAGAALITYSEKVKEKEQKTQAPVESKV